MYIIDRKLIKAGHRPKGLCKHAPKQYNTQKCKLSLWVKGEAEGGSGLSIIQPKLHNAAVIQMLHRHELIVQYAWHCQANCHLISHLIWKCKAELWELKEKNLIVQCNAC